MKIKRNENKILHKKKKIFWQILSLPNHKNGCCETTCG
jgi:hypothetical protein